MAAFTLEPGETILHEQVLIYTPPGGGLFNGKLTITNTRILYDAKYDVSAKGMLEEALFVKWGSVGYLDIPKSEVQSVDVQKKFLSKKCIVTLKDGSQHTWDARALGIDKVAETIQAK
jgi:hypothetical protein